MSLEVYGHLVDRAGEPERRLVGEVNRRADVLADVEALADTYRGGDGPRQFALRYVLAVDRQRHDRRLAELLRGALISEVHLEPHLPCGPRLLALDRGALDRQVVVHEHRSPLAEVQTVSPDDAAVRRDHAFGAG